MIRRSLASPLLLAASLAPSLAQDLEPRAYSVSPVGVNVLVTSYTRLRGDISFDPTVPVEDVNARINAVGVGYFRTLNVFGRSANIGVFGPYMWGTISGKLEGTPRRGTRSGLHDGRFRFAINLKGAPAMNLEEFSEWRQKTNIGASVVVVGPTGQYDPATLINIGKNRWAFKPEIGLSHAFRRRWILDLYGGVWFFTKDEKYQGGGRSQDPVGAVQTHISYNIKRGLWAAFDATFYAGGKQTVGDGAPTSLIRNTRYGGTVSIPLTRRQSIKVSANTGAFTSIGADFDSISIAYQYLFGGGL